MIWKITSIVWLGALVVGGVPAISEQKVKINHEHVGHHGELSHIGSHAPDHHEEYAWAYPSYEFSYKVNDPHTHDIKGQHESRHGDEVKGEYWLIEPDGRKRTVTYHADKKTGFKAHVEYSAPHHHVEFKTHRHHDHKPVVEHHHEEIAEHKPVVIEHKPVIEHKLVLEHKPIIEHHHVEHKPQREHHHFEHNPLREHHHHHDEHQPIREHHLLLHKPKIIEHIHVDHHADHHQHWENRYHHDDHHEPSHLPHSRPLIRRLQENYHHPRYYRTPKE